jgi:tetratricopeptide (TPR) repeat protein
MSETHTNSAAGGTASAVVQVGAIGTVYLNTPGDMLGVPWQLPPPVRYYVNRTDELAQITAAVTEHRDTGAGPGVIALFGPPGIGVTALAQRWLRAHHDRFPDGQLYADLADTDVTDVLAQFLRALGIRAGAVPDSPSERTQLWRTLTAARSVAVLLEHPRPEQDLLPLLPTGNTCVAIVASHQAPIGLLAHGAHPLRVGPLDSAAVTELISWRLQTLKPTAAAKDVAALAAWCGGHPRVLGLATAGVLAQPTRPVAHALTALRRAGARPSMENTWMSPDDSVSTRIDACLDDVHAGLSMLAQRCYPVLGQLPGDRLSAELLTATTGIGADTATAVLTEWQHSGLVQVTEHGVIHVLASAARHARGVDAPSDLGTPGSMIQLALCWYLFVARAAAALVLPARRPLSWQPPSPTPPLPVGLTDAPLDWLDRERTAIADAVRIALDLELDRIAVLLADALCPLTIMHKYDSLALTVDKLALRAAQRTGDHRGATGITKRIIRNHIRRGDLDLAELNNSGLEQQARLDGDTRVLASAIKTHGQIAAARGAWADAGTLFTQAADLLRELKQDRTDALALIELDRAEALALIELGDALVRADDPTNALEYLERADELLTGLPTPDRYNAARAGIRLAGAQLLTTSSTDPAADEKIRRLISSSLQVVRDHDSTYELTRAHTVFADYFDRRGDRYLTRHHRTAAARVGER